jgi:transcriptional regulator with XRE-family HTH domain
MKEIPNSLGKRIAYYRKHFKIGSTADLAAKIGHPPLTAAVIQNIESGRKTDIAVSQLLNIAFGLGISPTLLLTRLDDPFGDLDLPNLSENLRKMTPSQLDAWLSAASNEHVVEYLGVDNLIQQTARADIRKLMRDYEDWVYQEEDLASLDPDELINHAQLGDRIGRLYRKISEVVDVTWAAGPWNPTNQTPSWPVN